MKLPAVDERDLGNGPSVRRRHQVTEKLRVVPTVFVAALVIVASIGTGLGAQTSTPPPSADAGETRPQADSPSITRPNRISWSIVVVPTSRIAAGGTFNATVTAKIDPGWYLYSMSQPAGGPVATSVVVPKGQSFSLSGKVLEPTPTRRVDPNHSQLGESFTFDDLATFTVPLRVAAGTKAGEHVVRVEVEFQVCSDTVCLRPTTVELQLPVTVR